MGTSESASAYTNTLNVQGESSWGRKVTEAVIWRKMDCISRWISSSVLGVWVVLDALVPHLALPRSVGEIAESVWWANWWERGREVIGEENLRWGDVLLVRGFLFSGAWF